MPHIDARLTALAAVLLLSGVSFMSGRASAFDSDQTCDVPRGWMAGVPQGWMSTRTGKENNDGRSKATTPRHQNPK